MISLWVATAYLLKYADKKIKSLMTALPATFMSAVSMTYILMADEGFKISSGIAYPVGIIFAAVCFAVYVVNLKKSSSN
jgi:carbon starvation protein CstA